MPTAEFERRRTRTATQALLFTWAVSVRQWGLAAKIWDGCLLFSFHVEVCQVNPSQCPICNHTDTKLIETVERIDDVPATDGVYRCECGCKYEAMISTQATERPSDN